MKKVVRLKKFRSKKSHLNGLPLILSLIFLSSFVFIRMIKAEDPISTCDPMTGLNPDETNIGCGYTPSNDIIGSSTITSEFPTISPDTGSVINPISTCDPMTGLNSDGTNIGCNSIGGVTTTSTSQPLTTSNTTSSTTNPISTCDPMTGLNPDGTNIGCNAPIGAINNNVNTISTTTNESAIDTKSSEYQQTESDLQKSKLTEEIKVKAKKEAIKKKSTEEHMNEVAKQVKILSETKDDKNGVGQEVKEIAGQQDASQIKIAEALAKMATKDIWLKKITGYDREAVSSVQEEMASIRLRIKEIYAIQEQTKDKLTMSQLEDAANALIEQNAVLDDTLQEEMHNVGVWGWFENLIRKGRDSYLARFGS